MTDIELKYYKALQAVFKEKMGDWQTGDWFTNSFGEFITCVMDQDDTTLFDFYGSSYFKKLAIRLPLPIDPRNPERGLTGMHRHFRELVYNVTGNFWMCKVWNYENSNSFAADTPTLALLKALAWQEGV